MSLPPMTLLPSLVAATVFTALVAAQTGQYPLDSSSGLRLHNVVAAPATLDGKKGLRLTTSEDAFNAAMAKVKQLPPREAAAFQFEQLALIEGFQASDLTIEAEIAGTPGPGADAGARGFVGIAFRVQDDLRTYDAFYLRPTNGRAEDQLRRNHAAQYVSHPDWPWSRLRSETPGQYESYVDIVPGAWTKVRIEVRGDKGRLYVHNQEQPTLIVNDLKSGGQRKGAVALWIGPGTIGHFRNLTVR